MARTLATICAGGLLAVCAAPVHADPAATTPCASPQIEMYPMSQTVYAGQSVTFAALAPVACFTPAASIGTAEWQRSSDGGKTFSTIPGSASVILSKGSESTQFKVAAATASMSGFEYRAVFVFTNGSRSWTSGAATLTVRPAWARIRALDRAIAACHRLENARRADCLRAARRRYAA